MLRPPPPSPVNIMNYITPLRVSSKHHDGPRLADDVKNIRLHCSHVSLITRIHFGSRSHPFPYYWQSKPGEISPGITCRPCFCPCFCPCHPNHFRTYSYFSCRPSTCRVCPFCGPPTCHSCPWLSCRPCLTRRHSVVVAWCARAWAWGA